MQKIQLVDGDNVVVLSRFQKAMKFPAVQEMIAYWEGLRAGRPVPLRSEVDPRGIEGALEYAFILERIAPGIARFRLSGTHLNDLMGMEVRGMPLTAFISPDHRDEMTRITEAVFADPETAELTLAGEPGIGRPPLQAKLLLLPMKSDAGEINRALGCLVSDGRIGRNPRRFTIADVRMTRIPVPPPRPARPVATPATSAYGMAEPAMQFTPRSRGHLRLVKSDD